LLAAAARQHRAGQVERLGDVGAVRPNLDLAWRGRAPDRALGRRVAAEDDHTGPAGVVELLERLPDEAVRGLAGLLGDALRAVEGEDDRERLAGAPEQRLREREDDQRHDRE